MRAVVARHGELEVREVPDPTPGPGEVLVKTRACGICGSDLHLLQHFDEVADAARRAGGFFDAAADRDLILGHEFCAEVIDYGPSTDRRFAPGTLVCSQPVLVRGAGLLPLGFTHRAPGGYAQYMRLMEATLVAVPTGVTPEAAALTEPIAVALHAVRRAGVGPGDGAVVVGCGPVGLAVIAALRASGVMPIVAVDFSEARRKLASMVGADVVVDAGKDSAYERYRGCAAAPPGSEAVRPAWLPGPSLKPQVVFECVGAPGLIQQTMEGAEPGATIVVVGVCMQVDRFEPIFALNKELDLRFAYGHRPDEFEAALRLIASGELAVDALITGVTGLDGVTDAMSALARADRHAKILIDPWKEGGLAER